MAITLKPLAQLRVVGTSAQQVYAPAAGEEVVITSVRVVNTGSLNVTMTLYLDIDGSTWDDDSTVLPEITITAKKVYTSGGEQPYIMSGSTNTFAIKAGTSDELTISLFGFVRT